jgi:hypothetical protein
MANWTLQRVFKLSSQEIENLKENARERARDDIVALCDQAFEPVQTREIRESFRKEGETETVEPLALEVARMIRALEAAKGRPCARTRQQLRKLGVVDTARQAVTSQTKSARANFALLLELGLYDLSFEALVIRFSNLFDPQSVAVAAERLEQQVPMRRAA